MAAVFPENMDKLDTADVPGSLSKIENHIRYMQERVEFSMKNTTRAVSEAGVSNAQVYILLTAISNNLSALTSTVQGIQGDVSTMKADISTLNSSVDTLKTAVSSLESADESILQSIQALTDRVAALEKYHEGV